MARSRNIKPTFFTDAELLACDPITRLLFAGLWVHADRRGILADNVRQIKIDVFPADNVDVEGGLAQLAERGLILRYEREGKRCIAIPAFAKHQSPHPKEPASNLPAPEDRAEQVTSNLHVSDMSVSSPAVSCSLNPDVLIAESGEKDAPAALPAPAPAPVRYSGHFERFWAVWPKGHGAKVDAYRAWKRLGLDRAGAEDERNAVMAGLRAWKASERWRRGMVKTCSIWLRDRWWNDEPPLDDPPRAGPVSRASPGPTAEAIFDYAQRLEPS